MATEPKVVDAMHIGRSWPGCENVCEQECPCPKEPCGLVAYNRVDPDCPQHSFAAAKTIRQHHNPSDCPARPALVRWALRLPGRFASCWHRLTLRANRATERDRHGALRWALSYYLGIGQWFHDKRDRCHRCDALPSDIDFTMRRVGPRRAECIETAECRDFAAEMEAPDAN